APAPAAAQASEQDDAEVGWPESIPRVRWWEIVGTAALTGAGIALRFGIDTSKDATARGGIWFDEPTLDLLFIDKPRLYQDWRTVGDLGFYGSIAWSVADPLIAGAVYDWDTALQMTLMNGEAFAVYSTVLGISQAIVRRERPILRVCSDP